MRLYETYFEIEELWQGVEDILIGEVTEGPDGLPVTGDMALDWIEDALSRVEEERDEKALNIACLIKNFRADAEALKLEKVRLAKRQQAAEKTIERLTRYLEQFLDSGLKLKDSRATIGWRRSQRIVLSVPAEELPDEYVRIKREANLSLIKEDIKEGDEVPGAILEERQNIQIR
ncbi:MAG: siphovirus Gp157 family protein [Puniceicoccaceae bacterium]